MQAKELCPDLFKGERSRLIIEPIKAAVIAAEVPEEKALEAAKKLCGHLASIDEKAEKDNGIRKVKTLMFLSPAEIAKAGQALRDALKDGALDEKKIKSAAKSIQAAKLQDAADIALFGRMVAADQSLTVEGAAMFSHALSTHRADNDIDFFTAVDDRQQDDPSVADEDRTGSGMMGTLEFTSATYYRYVGLNVDLLRDEKHLQALPSEDFRDVVNAFLRACLMAVPSARRNSMNGSTLPGYVLGLARANGHPLQLVNAFEEPVRAKTEGLLTPSVKKLKRHFEEMKTTWGIAAQEMELPGTSVDQFCAALLKSCLAA
jgi:CRISPR system Cascade subunit CasC